MGCPQIPQSIEVIIEETESGVLVKSLNSLDKSTRNGYKIVVFDIDNVFVNKTRAAIDPCVIVSLELPRCNLNYFPDGFAGLNLKRLDLSYNKLQDVPDCILNGLRSLEILDLSHNAIKSFDQPKCVKNLRVLKINNNKLMDIPEWILNINAFNLEELYFSYNEITTLKKSRFFKTPSYELTKLELKNCIVRTQDFKFIKHIRTLTILDLSNEGQANRNCIANCDSFRILFDKPSWDDRLKILSLNNLEISFLPEEISQLVVLEELYLSNNDLMWLPDSIISMNKLRVLDISHNQIACFPSGINNMKNLETLKASYNNISRVIGCTSTQLQLLDLYNNLIDNDCDIQIDCNIPIIDLEQNYFDTANWNYKDYEKKKTSLRKDAIETRKDGPKEQPYDEKESTDSNYSDYDSSHEDGDNGVVYGDDAEETWSTDYKPEPCDNGCTLSDNEWTGSEPVRVTRKKVKPKLESYPSWVFEDV